MRDRGQVQRRADGARLQHERRGMVERSGVRRRGQRGRRARRRRKASRFLTWALIRSRMPCRGDRPGSSGGRARAARTPCGPGTSRSPSQRPAGRRWPQQVSSRPRKSRRRAALALSVRAMSSAANAGPGRRGEAALFRPLPVAAHVTGRPRPARLRAVLAAGWTNTFRNGLPDDPSDGHAVEGHLAARQRFALGARRWR